MRQIAIAVTRMPPGDRSPFLAPHIRKRRLKLAALEATPPAERTPADRSRLKRARRALMYLGVVARAAGVPCHGELPRA